jgi:predicted outer membrane repeat protein
MCVVGLVWLAAVGVAVGATLHVTSSADNGTAGTLRSVVAAAHTGDTIVIDPGVNPHLTQSTGISLLAGQAASLTIEGQAAQSTTITGNGLGSTISMTNDLETGTQPALTMKNLTMTGGGGREGGAIDVGFGTSATLTGVTLSGNGVTADGGALFVSGTADIRNSTITGNSAGTLGGGIYTDGQVSLIGDTVAANASPGGSGGNMDINNEGATITLSNTIVAGGTAASGPNCAGIGAFVSGGHNLESTTPTQCGLNTKGGDLIGVNPLLEPLGNYGGPTDTLALPPNSPAVDHGVCAAALGGVDQRGLPRPGAGHTTCSIGAYEFQNAATAVAVACNPSPAGLGVPTTCSATVTGQPVAGVGPPTRTVTFSGTAGSFGASATCMLSGAGTSSSCAVPLTPSKPGPQQVTAIYSGDSTHLGSSGSTPLSVDAGPPVSVSVRCSPGTVAPGGSTTCRVTVGPGAGGSAALPTGSVTFSVTGATPVGGGGTCALTPGGAQAACNVTYTLGQGATGTYVVTAAYGGDARHLPASAPTSFAATPVAGKAANATVVSGTVLIELPGSHTFAPLIARRDSPLPGLVAPIKGATVAVPMGSTVDTTKGRLQLATAASYNQPAHGPPPLQNATLAASIFSIQQMTAKQARAHLKHGQRLFGTPPTNFGLRTPPRAVAKARCRRTGAPGKGVVRVISASGKGLFRTIAANSITTVKSGTWIVSDRCDGTFTEVGRGSATVTPIHPTHKHEHPVTVGAGQGVLIKGRFL